MLFNACGLSAVDFEYKRHSSSQQTEDSEKDGQVKSLKA